jgi:hypothetical protein
MAKWLVGVSILHTNMYILYTCTCITKHWTTKFHNNDIPHSTMQLNQLKLSNNSDYCANKQNKQTNKIVTT